MRLSRRRWFAGVRNHQAYGLGDGAQFSPDGKFLASADRSGGLLIWDAETGRERGDLRGHTEQITSLSWRGETAVLASASEDDTARLWQLDGQQIKSWGAQGGGVASVRFARTGELTTTGRDQLVRLWNAEGGHIRDLATLEDLGLAARFTHDGARSRQATGAVMCASSIRPLVHKSP